MAFRHLFLFSTYKRYWHEDHPTQVMEGTWRHWIHPLCWENMVWGYQMFPLCVQMSLCRVIFWHQHNSLIRFLPHSQGSAGSFHSQSSFCGQGSLPFSLPFPHFLSSVFIVILLFVSWSCWIGILYVSSAAIINEIEICLIFKHGHLDSLSSRICVFTIVSDSHFGSVHSCSPNSCCINNQLWNPCMRADELGSCGNMYSGLAWTYSIYCS